VPLVRLGSCTEQEPDVDHEERQLTRADFADNEGWLRHLHNGGMFPAEQHDIDYEPQRGAGHYASLYRATNGPTRRDYERTWLFWGWSAYITYEQVVKSYHAAIYANFKGRVLNCFTTITWSTVGVESDVLISAYHDRFLEGLRKWHEQFGTEPAAVWVLERAGRRGLHSHILLNIPKKLEERFAAWAEQCVQTIVGVPLLKTEESSTVHVQVRGDYDLGGQWGWLRYIWKGIDPASATPHPAKRGEWLTLAQILGARTEFQGEIGRKRLGVSRNLDAAAVNAQWMEGLPPIPAINGWANPDILYTRWWLRYRDDVWLPLKALEV
jgi:hypothetical protein